MTAFWGSGWAITFMLAPCLLGFGGLLSEIHLAHSRHFSSLLHAFRRSACLPRLLQIWGPERAICRCLVVSGLSGILLYSKLSVQRGQLDREDLRDFPPELKRRLAITSWLIIIGFFWFMFAVVLLKLTRS